MFLRLLEESFRKALTTFPVTVLTGARQTGKSTLCQTLLRGSHRYVSLEDPDIRRRALEDPRTFLELNPPPVIFDEIQYVPELPSYIQGIVDKDRRRYGQFVLTGSQNFLLMEKVSQSLAGRTALLTLYPCSVKEIDGPTAKPRSDLQAVADWILRGGYPELRARPELDRKLWCASYIRLYLERDVRRLLNVGDLDTFERFIRLAAIRTGQILNISDLARDAGISPPTAMRWLSVLQASYQVHLLPSFHANLSKRLVKSPKIYFGDTALASYLMGLHDPEVLMQGPYFGPLFETAVFLEHIKWAGGHAELTPLHYLRTKDGLEVDLLVEQGGELHAREIKTVKTLHPSLGDGLLRTETLLKRPLNKVLLTPVGEKTRLKGDIEVRPWSEVAW